jgi:hypothetical protein
VPVVAAAAASSLVCTGGGAMAGLEAVHAFSSKGLGGIIVEALQPFPVEGWFSIR